MRPTAVSSCPIAQTAPLDSYQQAWVFFALQVHSGDVERGTAAAGKRFSELYIEDLPCEQAGSVAELLLCRTSLRCQASGVGLVRLGFRPKHTVRPELRQTSLEGSVEQDMKILWQAE